MASARWLRLTVGKNTPESLRQRLVRRTLPRKLTRSADARSTRPSPISRTSPILKTGGEGRPNHVPPFFYATLQNQGLEPYARRLDHKRRSGPIRDLGERQANHQSRHYLGR